MRETQSCYALCNELGCIDFTRKLYAVGSSIAGSSGFSVTNLFTNVSFGNVTVTEVVGFLESRLVFFRTFDVVIVSVENLTNTVIARCATSETLQQTILLV